MVFHLGRAGTAPDDGFRPGRHSGAAGRYLVGQFGSRSRQRDSKNQAGHCDHRQRPQPGAADCCSRTAFYRAAATPAHHCLYPFRRAKFGCGLRSGTRSRQAAPDEERRTAFRGGFAFNRGQSASRPGTLSASRTRAASTLRISAPSFRDVVAAAAGRSPSLRYSGLSADCRWNPPAVRDCRCRSCPKERF